MEKAIEIKWEMSLTNLTKNFIEYIFVIGFSLGSIGCSGPEQFLTIQNSTSEEIIIKNIFVDGKKMSSVPLYLPANSNKKFSSDRIYLKVPVKGVGLNVELGAHGTEYSASCKLPSPEYPVTCLYIVTFNGTEKLRCICDSYSQNVSK